MRTIHSMIVLSTAGVLAVACSKPHATSADRQAAAGDLQLANHRAVAVRISPDELGAASTRLNPVAALPRAPRVPSARSVAVVPASPDPVGDGPIPDLRTTGTAPKSQETIALRPSAAQLPLVPQGPSSEPADRTGFSMTPGGVPRGVVIRGGGVGDDHCDPHPRGGGLFGGIFGGIFRTGGGLAGGRAIPLRVR